MIWKFLSAGGWIPVLLLAVGATGYGWYRSNLEQARQAGIASQMAKQVFQLRQEFDSAAAVQKVADAEREERVARLAADSAHNDSVRTQLSRAVVRTSHRADSLLAWLKDTLPELAGQIAEIQAAKDTAEQRFQAEKDGRILAERARDEARAGEAEQKRLLAKAQETISGQATTIEQLQKVGHQRTGGFSILLTVLLMAGTFGLGAAAF